MDDLMNYRKAIGMFMSTHLCLSKHMKCRDGDAGNKRFYSVLFLAIVSLSLLLTITDKGI